MMEAQFLNRKRYKKRKKTKIQGDAYSAVGDDENDNKEGNEDGDDQPDRVALRGHAAPSFALRRRGPHLRSVPQPAQSCPHRQIAAQLNLSAAAAVNERQSESRP
ncbi:hypothetical protein BHE74_00051952 [Ensete ventricosum]|uniref:Uncharacterized protein n=1 Tax=Ensete ventricosum TaxID=4639 RepID=A0A444F4R7_ENSVE|nr:hypothetical protein B296_00038800 [Ensete ventricosum]RWW17583.1 hypothetical protein GW17_00018476 [Ensete ventricosum]RWW42498.1 hypothetical protein BHE74_00051952 [Ensete ventricosum]RZS24133.1 hypothetical protein BHM03_00057166 [Ensete ventricosum]